MAKDNAAVSTGAELHAQGVQQRIVPKGGQGAEIINKEGEDNKKNAPLKVRFTIVALYVSVFSSSQEGNPLAFSAVIADIYKQHTISQLARPRYCSFSGNSSAFWHL